MCLALPHVYYTDFVKYISPICLLASLQFRLIYAVYNSAALGIPKFLIPILRPLTNNLCTVDHSNNFVKWISVFKNANDWYMTSFDVKNLSTNVPVQKPFHLLQTNSTRTPPALS